MKDLEESELKATKHRLVYLKLSLYVFIDKFCYLNSRKSIIITSSTIDCQEEMDDSDKVIVDHKHSCTSN